MVLFQLSKDAIVEVWKGGPHHEKDGWKRHVKEVLRRQNKLILSSCWYLNYINYGEDWKNYYNCDPVLGVNGNYICRYVDSFVRSNVNSFFSSIYFVSCLATEAERELILGGEACMWSEYVDQVNILSRLW